MRNNEQIDEDLMKIKVDYKGKDNFIILPEEHKHLIDKSKTTYLCSQFFITKNLVSDVFRYTAEIIDNQCEHLHWNDTTAFPCSKYADLIPPIANTTIVLLLESPHKDEYCYRQSGVFPIAPAQGITGKGIENKLREVISEAFQMESITVKDGFYPVILSNPVPWQASLHYCYKDDTNMHSDLKNLIWRRLWKLESIKADFKRKLNQYSPVLIINACTGGNRPGSLNSGIQTFLKKNDFSNITSRSNHPSMW